MDSTRRGHVPISLTKAHDPPIARPTQKEQIGAVRPGIVRGFDSLIFLNLVTTCHLLPTLSIPLFEQECVVVEGLPDFHQWAEDVRCYRFLRRKCSQDGAAAKKWLEVGTYFSRKIRCDFMRKPLLVTYPLEQLFCKGWDRGNSNIVK